ncbi:MAG: hypothetical protein ACI3VN_07805 [Candidatus Onthomonas sp.]
MRDLLFQTQCLGWPIEARVCLLDEGVQVLVTGGCKTHVGAVSYAVPGEAVRTIQFPTHRDGVVGEQWAKALCEVLRCQVVVNCGIHYDHVSKAEIGQIVSAAEELLEKAVYALTP